MRAVSLRTRAGLSLYVRRAAMRCGVSDRTIRYWITEGKLSATRQGRRTWTLIEDEVNAVRDARDSRHRSGGA